MSKLDLSLDDLIQSDKKKKQFSQKAKQGGRTAGGGGRGGSAARGGKRIGGGGGRQGGQQQEERRQGGGVQRGQRRTRGQRASPYNKGNPEDSWSHDLYDEEEEGKRRNRVGSDLGNAGFLKRSLSGGDAGQRTTVEITNLNYDISKEELNELLSSVGDLIKADVIFDRSGRSEGIGKAVFESRDAANRAIREFDGKELEGETLSLKIVPNDAPRGKRGGGGGGSGGSRPIGGGTFQVSTSGGRKVITRARAADDRAFL